MTTRTTGGATEPGGMELVFSDSEGEAFRAAELEGAQQAVNKLAGTPEFRRELAAALSAAPGLLEVARGDIRGRLTVAARALLTQQTREEQLLAPAVRWRARWARWCARGGVNGRGNQKRARHLATALVRSALGELTLSELRRLGEEAEAWRAQAAASRKLEQDTAAEFVRQHTPANVGATEADFADLTRRLVEAYGARTPRQLEEAAETEAVRREREALEAAQREVAAAAATVSDDTTAQLEALERAAVAAARFDFVRLWSRVFDAWRQERPRAGAARMPAAFWVGSGALAPLFGHDASKRERTGRVRSRAGVVERLVVSRGVASVEAKQAQLKLTSRVAVGPNATPQEVVSAMAHVLGNRELRAFAACLLAAQEDLDAGRTQRPGSFWYSPGRFKELLHIDGKNAAKGIDASLEVLRNASAKATVKAGGRAFNLEVEAFIIDGAASLEAKAPGAGRRRAQLFSVQEHILGLVDAGAWFPLDRATLAPLGGDPRTNDDAFRLLAVLSAWARNEARKARGEGFPWRRKVSTIIDTAGLAAPGRSASKHEARLEQLLELLEGAGHLRLEPGCIDAGAVVYDLPRLRPSFVQVAGTARRKRAGAP